MLAILNGRERDSDEWQSLFKRTDSRFQFVGITEPEGSQLVMIEAVWSG
jgi:hypothetical protein